LLVAARLRELGVHRIAGTLRVRGTLIFNWQAEAAGARLRAALSGRAPPSAWETVRPLTSVSPEASSTAPAPPWSLKWGAPRVGPLQRSPLRCARSSLIARNRCCRWSRL